MVRLWLVFAHLWGNGLKLDVLTLGGVFLAVLAIIGGNLLEGGHTASLIQVTAFVIVVGGTIGAILVQTPMPVFLRAMRIAKWVVLPPRQELDDAMQRIIAWSQIARREGLLGLESEANQIDDPFMRRGLELLVDGSEPETIRAILDVQIASEESYDLRAAKVFEGMGGYSPTIGIIGAVMGLIHVMNNLADPSSLGSGIAVAFVATIYGVGLANLFLLPMANKLKAVIDDQAVYKEMVMEGLVSIAEGENPRNIASKLQGYQGSSVSQA